MNADSALTAICPIDGRYRRYTKQLEGIGSEYGLIKYRIEVMTRYLIKLLNTRTVTDLPPDSDRDSALMNLVRMFIEDDAAAIKALETKGWSGVPATNHDVKACEIWLRIKLTEMGFKNQIEWIHFGCTSEDVNNIAYALMLNDILSIMRSSIDDLSSSLSAHAAKYKHLPMLSRTHGQPATPTTLGKEFKVFAERYDEQLVQLADYSIRIKLNGASGNYAAMVAAYPDVNWHQFSKEFVDALNAEAAKRSPGKHKPFVHNPLTTQIEPHDTYAELFHLFVRINVITLDTSNDLWRYVSDDWLVQKPVEGEVGSSAMPHKVNPIQAENCEGNLGLANALLEHCARKLPVSRLQRDLSDSTVERWFGTMFGICLVAYENLNSFLKKISANEAAIAKALDDHPEVITEAYQTILRSVGYPDPYGALKTISRGRKITMEDLHAFIFRLDPQYVSDEVKERMRAITPHNYIGLAAEL